MPVAGVMAGAAVRAAGVDFLAEAPRLIEGSAGIAHEGPSFDPATGWTYFVGRNRVSRVNDVGKIETVLDPSPGANGSRVDPQGRVLVCESGITRRVIRVERDGSVTVIADTFQGKKFNSPNDVALDRRGRIYFTDPNYSGNRDRMEIRDATGKAVEGVYRVDAPGVVTQILGSAEVERPNGILLSPDERVLYIADNNNDAGGIRALVRFVLQRDGTVDRGSRRIIFDWHTGRGPDGFKLDSQGNFWVAAGVNRPSRTETADEFKGGIFVISPKGKLLQFIGFERDQTTNCGFAGKDLKTLYVTAGEGLYRMRTTVGGRL